ncbi:MAG: hypothetical protein JW973_06825 [Bacteroidales bacterium]|nr:hypothetical protein [Bacteroidales bacterium]MBN2814741.1 hypothetical protein [Bacteroidales bacterium]
MRSFTRVAILMMVPFLVLLTDGCALQNKASTAAKKKEQVERSYKKAYAKARKKTIKHRYDIQSDATKEMMDESRRRADAYNRQGDPNWWERYFKRKKPGKR